MAAHELTEEQLQEAADALTAHGSQVKAAAALGLSRPTFQHRLRAAALRGLTSTAPVMPGFEITKVTNTPNGDYIQQKPERGDEFEIPAGHVVKGVSALVGPDGRVTQQWVKTREEGPSLEDKIAVIEKAFENFKPSSPYVARAKDCDKDRLTAYVFCDWHLGLFAHGKETGGPDWDLSIAKRVLTETVAEVIDQSPRSGQAVLLGLGDLLHADNSRNMTERSGNVLDVDTRYSKVLETCCDIMAEASERIALRHASVELTFKPGNHDPESTVGIRQALRMYHRKSKSVTVDTSPNPFYWKRFGVNLIGGTHGDKAKPKDLPLIMANIRAKDWSEVKTRHIHTGHIHHDTEIEEGGVHVFSHRAPVAQDAYHASHGFLSGRSMKSYTYHVEKGSRGRAEVEIR